ncbi:SDR family NAD(P)-dependent oxidoreductase [Spirosoma utsteinense]|uniref:Butyryl-CoA dehydrogenase n=1 Tax=Spirosoma utsteinense TaxID=2585773 RepID=A0ABR6WB56_9BACT|nr:SDR family NAD(P)-dependent oxidoreductase [Spirosoma utsteinense]MBC3786801.1 butyryl-CoA dehydrogenase [Spirosoma utsteinense]MBC3793777.1 butyryl-CoA dehydrogenase [Spirosoma utsteinense]
MNLFQNTTVIITGAGSGIGRQLTSQAAAEGAHVIATDVNETGLAETKQLASGNVTTARLDVADAEAIRSFADKTIPTLANTRLVLINNAGVALGSGPFSETSLDDFDWLLNINLWGVIRMTKAFLPYMLDRDRDGGPGSHIVNLSSVFGLAGVMHQSAYCTAKFGVRGFSDVLRMELMDTRIRVTCVHPGGIKTNIAANARLGSSGFVSRSMHRQGAASFARVARTTPEEAARQIIAGIRQQKARVLIGTDAYQIEWLTRLFPTRYVQLMRQQIEKTFGTTGQAIR